MKGFDCESSKNEKQHKSEVIASKTHQRHRRTSSVKSIISKLQKDAGKCYDNPKSLMQIWSLFYQKEMQFKKRKNEIKILLSDLEEEVENLKKDKRKLMHK